MTNSDERVFVDFSCAVMEATTEESFVVCRGELHKIWEAHPFAVTFNTKITCTVLLFEQMFAYGYGEAFLGFNDRDLDLVRVVVERCVERGYLRVSNELADALLVALRSSQQVEEVS